MYIQNVNKNQYMIVNSGKDDEKFLNSQQYYIELNKKQGQRKAWRIP